MIHANGVSYLIKTKRQGTEQIDDPSKIWAKQSLASMAFRVKATKMADGHEEQLHRCSACRTPR